MRPIAEEWVGHWVLMEYIGGPKLDYDAPENTVEGPLVARASTVFLERVDDWGVESRFSEEKPVSFLPWSAIMRITGPSREELERKGLKQTRETDTPPA